MLIGPSINNWYRGDVSYSIELINSFIEGVENQAVQLGDRYDKEKQTHVLEDDIDGQKYDRLVETHAGLDSESWDLEEIFNEYFPNLHRRAALSTLCGYFEHQLENLCALYKSEKAFRLSSSDLNGKGIYRSTGYLEKVAGINVHKDSQMWGQIVLIQKIRNICIHQDGRLRDGATTPSKAVIDFIKKNEFLAGEAEVILKKGFLAYVAKTYHQYFQQLDKSIQA